MSLVVGVEICIFHVAGSISRTAMSEARYLGSTLNGRGDGDDAALHELIWGFDRSRLIQKKRTRLAGISSVSQK